VTVESNIELVSSILSIIGVLILSIPKRLGLWVLLVAQVLWTIFGYLKGQQYFLIQSIIMIGINVMSIYNWKRKNVG